MTKIKQNYESHIKYLTKQVATLGKNNPTSAGEDQKAKEEASAKELEEER